MAKILITAVHEAWQESLCKTGHEFFFIRSQERKDGWKDKERKQPNNLKEVSENVLLDKEAYKDFISKIDFLITNTIEQREFGLEVKNMNPNIKWIEMYHCFPYITWDKWIVDAIKEKYVADLAVFATVQSASTWGFSLDYGGLEICGHTAVGFDHLSYIGGNSSILSVAYDFKERANLLGYNEWKQIVNGFDHIHIGNEDFATLATKKELNDLHYRYNDVFLNTAHHSPIPTSLLEAMSVGMPVLNVDTPTNRDIFKGYEEFLYNDIFDAKNKIKRIIKDKEYRDSCSLISFHIFTEKFSQERFINNWKEILN